MYNLHTSKFPNIFKTTGLVKIVFIIDHHTPYRNIPWWSIIIPPTGISRGGRSSYPLQEYPVVVDHHTPYRNIPWWSIIPPTGITLIEGTSIYLRFKIPHIGHPYNNSPHNYNRLISIFTVDTFHFRINA